MGLNMSYRARSPPRSPSPAVPTLQGGGNTLNSSCPTCGQTVKNEKMEMSREAFLPGGSSQKKLLPLKLRNDGLVIDLNHPAEPPFVQQFDLNKPPSPEEGDGGDGDMDGGRPIN